MTHDPSIPHEDSPENRLLPHHLEQLTQGFCAFPRRSLKPVAIGFCRNFHLRPFEV